VIQSDYVFFDDPIALASARPAYRAKQTTLSRRSGSLDRAVAFQGVSNFIARDRPETRKKKVFAKKEKDQKLAPEINQRFATKPANSTRSTR
jgi:hypothetical protein